MRLDQGCSRSFNPIATGKRGKCDKIFSQNVWPSKDTVQTWPQRRSGMKWIQVELCVCIFVCCCCCWCSCCICCCSIAYICIDRTLQICTHTCRDTHTHKHTHIHMSGDTQCCRSKISDWLVISATHVWSNQPQEVQCLVKLRIKKLHLLLCLLHEGESWEPRCFSLIAGSASWHNVFLFQ